jgi:DNA repair protein RecO (recombination protein O)
MRELKIQAITIGYANYREYDRVLTLFSPERGVIAATAHAVRRQKSDIRACADLFFYGEFVLKQNDKGYLSVSSIDMTDIFYDLRTDINRLSCATYMCDFVRATALSDEEQSEYFVLLIRSLQSLCYDKPDYRALKLKFEISAMELLGYGAIYDACANCGEKLKGSIRFSDSAGGALCQSCNPERHGAEISLRALATLKQISEMPVKSLAVLKIKDEVYDEMNKHFKRYMYWHLERSFKSAAFLEKKYNFIM